MKVVFINSSSKRIKRLAKMELPLIPRVGEMVILFDKKSYVVVEVLWDLKGVDDKSVIVDLRVFEE